MEPLKDRLERVGQQHLLKFYNDLDDFQRSALERDIADVDWETLNTAFKEQVSNRLDGSELKPVAKINEDLLQELPEDHVSGTTRCTDEELNKYRSIGLSSIREGKVAALLLAGGQGTRLGVDYPKGMYDVGLPSGKSLFQLQAERIIETSKTAHDGQEKQSIIWYIMTSETTMSRTREFFKVHNYFGLQESSVVFFEQNTIPCFDLEGKVLLSEKHQVSRSPNGNGGLYESLHEKHIIDHMVANHVKYVHVYCVDNVLVRVCDPTFAGYFITKQAEVGAKVVEKKQPDEPVGTICKVGHQFKVIEYSEITDAVANKRNPLNGKLLYNAANICEHIFTVDFLKTIKADRKLPYHLAIKKIPFVSLETGELVKPDRPNGIKLEKFIFDVFEFADNFVAWEVVRENEFSPLKNSDKSSTNNPTTARESLSRAYKLGILNT